MGILGNVKADVAAKSALSLPVTRMKLPATGMYLRITKLIFDEWQEVWDCCAGNKLHAITAMSHLRFSRAILSREKVMLSATVKLHAATLSHKQTKQNGL